MLKSKVPFFLMCLHLYKGSWHLLSSPYKFIFNAYLNEDIDEFALMSKKEGRTCRLFVCMEFKNKKKSKPN